jgi:hypothetical protein
MTHAEKRADRYNEATRNKQDRRIPMSSDGLEPAISAFERPQTYALDCRVTGIDSILQGASQFGNSTKYHGRIMASLFSSTTR